jgi:hypothetical protein
MLLESKRGAARVHKSSLDLQTHIPFLKLPHATKIVMGRDHVFRFGIIQPQSRKAANNSSKDGVELCIREDLANTAARATAKWNIVRVELRARVRVKPALWYELFGVSEDFRIVQNVVG